MKNYDFEKGTFGKWSLGKWPNGRVSKLLSVLGQNGTFQKKPVAPPYGPVLLVSKKGLFGTTILKRAHLSRPTVPPVVVFKVVILNCTSYFIVPCVL